VNVRVAELLDGARDATGHAVIVDVFRAFTTAAFCIAAGAREIVLVSDHEQALAMKREDSRLFLTGEIDGQSIEVAMGDGGTEPNPEDPACVEYLASLLGGAPIDIHGRIAALPQWRRDPWPDWFPRQDAELACQVDRFDFALPVTREDGLLIARPVR